MLSRSQKERLLAGLPFIFVAVAGLVWVATYSFHELIPLWCKWGFVVFGIIGFFVCLFVMVVLHLILLIAIIMVGMAVADMFSKTDPEELRMVRVFFRRICIFVGGVSTITFWLRIRLGKPNVVLNCLEACYLLSAMIGSFAGLAYSLWKFS